MPARALVTVLALAAAARSDDFDYQITDDQYYSMPRLFELDEYRGCAARRDLYCVGTFDLAPRNESDHELFIMMKRYSANWVDHYNHTRLHRGVCVSRACPQPALRDPRPDVWFTNCVNASTWSSYGLSARLARLEYCARAPPPAAPGPPRALAGAAAALLVAAAVSSALDLSLSEQQRKGAGWLTLWSVRAGWRTLTAPPPASPLNVFDGVRVVCMLCVIVEHVTWLGTLTFVADPRFSEVHRRSPDAMLLTNSTLVVQVFFMMSTFLLAHKLRAPAPRLLPAFASTMLQRIVRIAPLHLAAVWFAAAGLARLGTGPLWPVLAGGEEAACRRKWWAHVLLVHNVVQPDDKCLIQTWYLAADTQLYALALALTLLGVRARALLALQAAAAAALGALAYLYRLQPTFVMHSPEQIRAAYHDNLSFNLLYQSPLGNVPGALAGLLLARAARALHQPAWQHVTQAKWFRWGATLSFPLAFLWVLASPRLLGAAPAARAAAAAFAALERTVFVALIGAFLLGALHGVHPPWVRVFRWAGWAAPARLSFAALLVHMPLNKMMVASRLAPVQLDRTYVLFSWCAIGAASYLVAVPLTLLIELPALRVLRAVMPPPPPPPAPPRGKDGRG